MCDVIIIGAGASGIVSSIFAKRKNNKVIVLERNDKSLKKLLMTGNGRCNYMNEVYNTSKYHSEDIDIVDKIISSNNIEMVKEFFDSIGVIPKIKNGYYYPYSNQAVTIKNMLEEKAISLGVEIKYNSLVTDICKENERFVVICNNEKLYCDNLVIATGSRAYPVTGSDGSGYKFLSNFNHTIVDVVPSLVQLTSDFKYLKLWDGVRSDVVLELFEDDKYIATESGEIQLTNYGVSGICVFNLSHYVTRGIKNHKYTISINFVPFIDTLITPWMDNYSKKNSDKKLYNLLEGLLNTKLIEIILKVSNIDGNSYYNDLSNNEKLILCKNLKGLKINIIGHKLFDNSQICSGGVKLSEIDYNTFESKLVSNLYITGELLDMNGICGGYNLTTCWISGILSGRAIGDKYD
ncbi:MAG: aminoacetone oxidase family FAD-binding enzyme [Bacilli bacterium]|nr:aminoacetone oxidase family FAD-binding enzyme [Bacilli bacterium]